MAAVAAPSAACARAAGRALCWAPEAAVLGGAAALRLVALSRVPTDPYYDAAVRSMGTSWTALVSGAFEPGGRVAIDKPPLDLWLQVAATKLLGFGSLGLHLPAALGGIALVALVMALLRTLFGRAASLAGGAALAVLPSAVVTARSDTMDAVMAALAVAGALVAVRAARRGRAAPMLLGGALVGLSFDVKLAEALLPAAAVGALWLACAPRGVRRRGALLGTAAFAVTAVAWLAAVTALPLHPRPWALGSTSGSPWQAALVYDGVDRLEPAAAAAAPRPPAAAPATAAQLRAARARHAREHAAALRRRPGPPSPERLLTTRDHVAPWIGAEAVAAAAAFLLALLAGRPRRLDRVARGGLLALGGWLAAGIVLASAMPDLRLRYLSFLDPAVAAALGAGAGLLARRPRAAPVVALAVAAALAVPVAASVAAVRGADQDSGRPGAIPAARVAALSAYLAPRTAGAADELAASAPAKVGSLIARDGRPVLVLSDGQGRQLVTPARLAAQVAAGQVRYALLGDACTATSGTAQTGCLPVVRWARAHGRDVSRAAGQPHPGLLYALTPPAAGRAASGRTPRCATSSRTPRAPGSSGGRRASRAPGGRAGRARRASRRRSRARRPRARRARGPSASPCPCTRRCAASARGSA